MHHFEYRDGELYAEGVAVQRIAREVGTPAYVYSLATLRRHYRVFDQAFAKVPHLVCFAMKSNSNLAVLRTFANVLGHSIPLPPLLRSMNGASFHGNMSPACRVRRAGNTTNVSPLVWPRPK